MKPETFLPNDYKPAESEPFMNDRQLEYFRRKLLAWKEELLEGSKETLVDLANSSRNLPDVADRASEETDRALELRTRDRQRKLISKIDAALRRIEQGEGQAGDIDKLRAIAEGIEGKTICAFGEAAAWPVQGLLNKFWDEFEYYVEHKRSMVEAA